MDGFKRLIPGTSSSGKPGTLILALILVALIGLGSAGYFYYQLGKTQGYFWSKKGPQASQKAEQEAVGQLVKEVGKLIDLPANETPTVATVTDVNKIKSEPFFQNAKNGYKVLIYQNAKKVILYDPSGKKIVNVGPFSLGANQATPSAQTRIALRNGTSTPAMAAKVEAAVIKKSFPESTVVSKENTASPSYDKTIVVVLNNALKDFASALAKVLNANIADLPSGETKPKDADILIIVGKDKVGLY